MRTYQNPQIDIIMISVSDLMQGIIIVSGENGPIVNPNDPIIDPDDPYAGLVNYSNILWDENELED